MPSQILSQKLVSNKIKIIYIAGLGRSGTTLLDRVLGQADNACSTGELKLLWRRGCVKNQLCGCGKSFNTCMFWYSVMTQWHMCTKRDKFCIEELVAAQQESISYWQHITNPSDVLHF